MNFDRAIFHSFSLNLQVLIAANLFQNKYRKEAIHSRLKPILSSRQAFDIQVISSFHHFDGCNARRASVFAKPTNNPSNFSIADNLELYRLGRVLRLISIKLQKLF